MNRVIRLYPFGHLYIGPWLIVLESWCYGPGIDFAPFYVSWSRQPRRPWLAWVDNECVSRLRIGRLAMEVCHYRVLPSRRLR